MAVLLALLGLSVCVLVHETGHFSIAKLFKIKTLVFSLGFGPRLVGFEKGGTDYRLSLLPFGGYVRFELEESAPRWQKLCVLVAGPMANFLLGIAIMSSVYMTSGYEKPAFLEKSALVGYVVPDGFADKADLRKGDYIVAVNGKKTENWQVVVEEMMFGSAKPLSLLLRRGKAIFPIILPLPEGKLENFWREVAPAENLIVKEVYAGYPAAQAGIVPGDRIISINGIQILTFYEFKGQIQQLKDGPTVLSVQRDGLDREINLAGRYDAERRTWFVGVVFFEEKTVYKLPPFAAVQQGTKKNAEWVALTARAINSMARRELSPKETSGPIGIVDMAGKTAKAGATPFLEFMALISVSLAFFNILPIPVLDGGWIAITAIEMIRRKDLSLGAKAALQSAGLALLVLIAFFTCSNDISKLLKGR